MSNKDDSLARLIDSTDVNQYGGYCTRGKRHSPSKIAEYTGTQHALAAENGRKSTASECQSASKISKRQLALKHTHYIQIDVGGPRCQLGHDNVGALSSLDEIGRTRIDLHCLYLQWRSRPFHSCASSTKDKHGITIYMEAISRQLVENNNCKGILPSKKCASSGSKCTTASTQHYDACKAKMETMHHYSTIFVDEKSFMINDLLKYRVRRDPLTGETLEILACSQEDG